MAKRIAISQEETENAVNTPLKESPEEPIEVPALQSVEPMENDPISNEINPSKKNIMENFRHKKQKKFRFDPRDDLPRSSDSKETIDLYQCQKTKFCGKVSRDRKSLDEHKSGNTYKKVHYEHISSQKGSQGSIEPEAVWQAPTSRDTRSASVSQHYDAQEESEQVLQKGTEAIFKVSHYDINEQRANFDTLHEKPDPLPSKPSLPVPAEHSHEDQDQSEDRKAPQDAEDMTSQWDSSTQAPVMEHQTTPSQGSPANQISPATSTSPIDLG